MKTRAEAAQLARQMLDDHKFKSQRDKGYQWHFGRQELRELFDFIFEGPPKHKEEEL